MSANRHSDISKFSDGTNTRELGSIYKSLHIEPIINCGGVRSAFGGSNPLPQVIEAMNQAATEFIVLDELADAAGRNLAAMTGAEWGMIASCSTAAMALATAACIAGHNPERMLQLPETSGLRKKVVIPRSHRFAYDSVFKTVGAELVEFTSLEEFHLILDESVAMICLLGRVDTSDDLNIEQIIPIAKLKGIPVLVDAAAQTPSSPDKWIQIGADLVVYSGGKFLRGPQSTGFLIGSKNICEMAWLNGPPHQSFGRAMKIGKEEIVGALVAMNHFLHERDSCAEQQKMRDLLIIIKEHLDDIQGVQTEIIPSNAAWYSPRIRIVWDPRIVKLNGDELRIEMDKSKPRIHIHDVWSTDISIIIDPFNLNGKQASIVGISLAKLFQSHKNNKENISITNTQNFKGKWIVMIDFLHGQANHEIFLDGHDFNISGFHQSSDSIGEINGSIKGNKISLVAKHGDGPTSIYFSFLGNILGNRMKGELELGAARPEHYGPVFRKQFGVVKWTARSLAPDSNQLSAHKGASQ